MSDYNTAGYPEYEIISNTLQLILGSSNENDGSLLRAVLERLKQHELRTDIFQSIAHFIQLYR